MEHLEKSIIDDELLGRVLSREVDDIDARLLQDILALVNHFSIFTTLGTFV
jgi:hypothetical protein